MTDKAHPDAVPAQDPRQLVIDPARDPDALKCTVYGLHSVKGPAAALLNQFGPGGRWRGDECREGGELCVSLLSFGSEN